MYGYSVLAPGRNSQHGHFYPKGSKPTSGRRNPLGSGLGTCRNMIGKNLKV